MSARGWCYTLNNWTNAEFSSLKNLECKYHIIGREIGEKGTPHLQGYLSFEKTCRIKSLKKLNERIHWEMAKDGEKAINYCMKEDSDPFIKDNRKQGQRSDLINLTRELNEGKSVTEVAKAYPSDYIRYHAGIEKYAKLVQVSSESAEYSLVECCKYVKLFPIQNYTSVVIGDAGCGKTQYALSHFVKPLLVTHIDDLLNLQQDNDGIVFDDMDFTHWHRTHQIHILDYDNTRSIHCRYRTASIPKHTFKIFTGNKMMFNWGDDAIWRRMSVTEVGKR